MNTNLHGRTGGEILVDQLSTHGIKHVFCVPGESYLAALDAFYDSDISITVCRHEGGAAMMAEAVGKATGQPGICFVTRGPGATNAAPGVHIARQDSTPMILFVGQIKRQTRDREAFQELDYRALFGSIAKWVTEIDHVERIPELVARAFFTATAGRPGPVVIALPEDMLVERHETAGGRPFQPIETWPGISEIDAMHHYLAAAEKPIAVLGGSRWSANASTSFMQFAERFDLPVCTAFRRAHLMDALHRCYAGDLGIAPNPSLLNEVKTSDLVLLVGDRMDEISSQGYTLFDIPDVKTKLIHVYPDVEEIGRVYQPSLGINASPTAFCTLLSSLQPIVKAHWRKRADAMHSSYLAWSDKATHVPGSVNLGKIIIWLREKLSPEAFICNGAGNFASWIHRFYRFRSFGTQVAPTSGSMGYGVPAAVAMQRLYPDRPVVCVAGDGDFLMNGQEFATAVQYQLPIIVVVVDNSSYGTIRMYQERKYPGRAIATTLKNPDFASYARAFNGYGVTVERTEDFPNAFHEAVASGKASIVHLKVDSDAITPTTTLSTIRREALAG